MKAPTRQLLLLALAVFLAMGLWFSASAVSPQLAELWDLDGAGEAWMTMSVQLGFVLGALLSAIFNLPDRLRADRLLALSALAGAVFNGAIPLLIDDEAGATTAGAGLAIALRLLTGLALAGVYPPGMKLMATWFQSGRGLAIGILVGALTLGSAAPHLLKAIPAWSAEATWRPVLLLASAGALASAALAFVALRPGPHFKKAAAFEPRAVIAVWADPAVRRANFGYLGHMWELYAMWAWAPIFVLEAYENAGWSPTGARLAAFGLIAIGGLGSALAGAWADRIGRTATTSLSLIVSGACALSAGWLFHSPLALTVLVLVWGFAVVADSAQFSTAVTELCEPAYVGTALTIQTCAGFLLTAASIRLVPVLRDSAGWPWAFAALALGPVFGIAAMLRLRAMPEAIKMASGKR